MGRRRKKEQLSTRTAVILAGSAVAVLLLIGFVIVIRSSMPTGRHARPNVPQDPEAAWQSLVGTWTHKAKSPNSVVTSTYRFTDDRKFIRSTSVRGGVVGAIEDETTMPVLGVNVWEDEIELVVGPGTSRRGLATPEQTLVFYFTGKRTIALLTDADEDLEHTKER